MPDDTTSRTCKKCNVTKPLSEFYLHRPGQWRSDCKPCHLAARAVWRDANRPMLHKLYYGITDERYAELLAAQGGTCAICHEPETATSRHTGKAARLQVDHDHRCCSGRQRCGECVRGLLCGRCNRALGLLQDDAELVLAAAVYLSERT